MIAHAKRLTKNKFARNVAVVASGTAGAQVITMAFSPIITRLYGPEAFGVLGTFTAILAVLASLAALNYPIAIVLPKRDADALGLAKLSLGVALVMSLLTALILMLFKAPIVSLFNLEAVESCFLMLTLGIIVYAAMAVMSQWVIRKKLFNVMAKVSVVQALWLNMVKVGIGLHSPLAAVLVVLATVGSALHALMLWVGVRKSPEGRFLLLSSAKGPTNGKSLAWQYRDFAYYRTPQALLNALSQSLPVLMLARFFGPEIAGFYALSAMALGVPSHLIGQSVADVFYPRFVETLQEGGDGKSIIVKACVSLLGVSLFPCFIIVVTGPFLFSFIFGGEWEMAGQFSQWMAVWLLTLLISRPVIAAIPALRLQRQFLIFELLALGVRAAAIYLGYIIFSSAIITVAFFSIANAGIYLILSIYVAVKSGSSSFHVDLA